MYCWSKCGGCFESAEHDHNDLNLLSIVEMHFYIDRYRNAIAKAAKVLPSVCFSPMFDETCFRWSQVEAQKPPRGVFGEGLERRIRFVDISVLFSLFS